MNLLFEAYVIISFTTTAEDVEGNLVVLQGDFSATDSMNRYYSVCISSSVLIRTAEGCLISSKLFSLLKPPTCYA